MNPRHARVARVEINARRKLMGHLGRRTGHTENCFMSDGELVADYPIRVNAYMHVQESHSGQQIKETEYERH